MIRSREEHSWARDPKSRRGGVSLSLSSHVIMLDSRVRGYFLDNLMTLDFHSLINFCTFNLSDLGEFTLHTPITRP